MNKCEKCGASADDDETYELAGKTLCEDCYLEQKIKPAACDPWAVYSAKNTMSQDPGLTDMQARILDLIKTKGPLEAADICRELGISETEFQNGFATLRHMELARGFKEGLKVFYTQF